MVNALITCLLCNHRSRMCSQFTKTLLLDGSIVKELRMLLEVMPLFVGEYNMWKGLPEHTAVQLSDLKLKIRFIYLFF